MDTSQAPFPENTGEVWPPPISSAAQSNLIVPFKTMILRVSGSVPDFRVGNIEIGRDGIVIRGRAITPAETQIPILIATLFSPLIVSFSLFMPVYIILEFVIRNDRILSLTWDQIQQVVIVPKKRYACFVYHAPNHKGIVKPYSLTFKLGPEQYEDFTSAVNDVASPKLYAGNLKTWQSQASIIFFIGVCLYIISALSIHP